jgi:hypothetical protein
MAALIILPSLLILGFFSIVLDYTSSTLNLFLLGLAFGNDLHVVCLTPTNYTPFYDIATTAVLIMRSERMHGMI